MNTKTKKICSFIVAIVVIALSVIPAFAGSADTLISNIGTGHLPRLVNTNDTIFFCIDRNLITPTSDISYAKIEDEEDLSSLDDLFIHLEQMKNVENIQLIAQVAIWDILNDGSQGQFLLADAYGEEGIKTYEMLKTKLSDEEKAQYTISYSFFGPQETAAHNGQYQRLITADVKPVEKDLVIVEKTVTVIPDPIPGVIPEPDTTENIPETTTTTVPETSKEYDEPEGHDILTPTIPKTGGNIFPTLIFVLLVIVTAVAVTVIKKENKRSSITGLLKK